MKAINFFVLFAISALFVFSACRDENPEERVLDASTKAYFDIGNGSSFIFTDASDTNISTLYTSAGKSTGFANPDIENSEYLIYDLNSGSGQSFTIRCQSGGYQYKDQIALLTKRNDSVYVGPVIFNLAENFTPGVNSRDSVFKHATYELNSKPFSDVVRVKLAANSLYKEVYFAKGIGLIGYRSKFDRLTYVKRYTIR